MKLEFPTTAETVGKEFGAAIIGDAKASIHAVGSLQDATKGILSFFANPKYALHLNELHGAVLFTRRDLVRTDLPITYLIVEDPQWAFAQVASRFRIRPKCEGISNLAQIHPTAEISEGVSIGAFAVIGEKVVLGKNSIIHSFTYLSSEVKIGEDCEIFPHVTIFDRTEIGNAVQIFSGSVIGSDGFGFIETGETYTEMPQIGTVVIEDKVRIGAHCTIDRGTLGTTRIGAGTKLDDQVHVGHNCQIGKDCILCAQVGLGGSAILEDNVILGGQVGLGDHVRVGKYARMGGQSGSSTNVRGNETYFLTPALPITEVKKTVRALRKLPELLNRVSNLERIFKKDG